MTQRVAMIEDADHGRNLACGIASGAIGDFHGETASGKPVAIFRGRGDDGETIRLEVGDRAVAEYPIVASNGFKTDPKFKRFIRTHFRVPKAKGN